MTTDRTGADAQAKDGKKAAEPFVTPQMMAIEAELTAKRAALASTVDELAGRLDPRAQAAKAVGQSKQLLRDAVDPDAPLSGLGLDSLMAVELRNEIRGRLGVSLAIAGLLSGATIRSVSQQIATQVADGVDGGGGSDGGAIRRVARAEDVAAQLLAQVEQAAGTETVGSVAGAPAATSAEQGNV